MIRNSVGHDSVSPTAIGELTSGAAYLPPRGMVVRRVAQGKENAIPGVCATTERLGPQQDMVLGRQVIPKTYRDSRSDLILHHTDYTGSCVLRTSRPSSILWWIYRTAVCFNFIIVLKNQVSCDPYVPPCTRPVIVCMCFQNRCRTQKQRAYKVNNISRAKQH